MNYVTKKAVKNISVYIIIKVLCTIASITAFSFSLNKIGLFRRNKIAVNFNDGKPLIENPIRLAPSEACECRAFIENTGECAVYYRFYIKEIKGELSNKVILSISIDDKTLYEGKAIDFNVKNAVVSGKEFLAGERVDVLFVVLLDETAELDSEGQEFTFDLQVDVVQAKNNPNKSFG